VKLSELGLRPGDGKGWNGPPHFTSYFEFPVTADALETLGDGQRRLVEYMYGPPPLFRAKMEQLRKFGAAQTGVAVYSDA